LKTFCLLHQRRTIAVFAGRGLPASGPCRQHGLFSNKVTIQHSAHFSNKNYMLWL
jgi:hypothetical protein